MSSEPTLLTQLVEQLCAIVQAGVERVATCGELRISCEGWLKIELACALRGLGLVVQPELDNTDIVVSRDGQETRLLVELKTFPTNYGGGGKPITNFVAGVVKDLKKLKGKRRTNETGLAVWLAYPIPRETPPQWPRHVEKVVRAAARKVHSSTIALGSEDLAHLYIMESL